jgi:hypothetical protein
MDGPMYNDFVDHEEFARLIVDELRYMLSLSGHHYDWVTVKFKERLGIK